MTITLQVSFLHRHRLVLWCVLHIPQRKNGEVKKYSFTLILETILNLAFRLPLGNFSFMVVLAKTPYSSISVGVGFSINGFFWN